MTLEEEVTMLFQEVGRRIPNAEEPLPRRTKNLIHTAAKILEVKRNQLLC
jgi:hypothetical protein